MTPKRPPAVAEVQDFWVRPPLEPSPRCEWWKARIADGWRPNRRLSSMGYHTAAQWYGVYIWEWINVLWPLIREMRAIATSGKAPGR